MIAHGFEVCHNSSLECKLEKSPSHVPGRACAGPGRESAALAPGWRTPTVRPSLRLEPESFRTCSCTAVTIRRLTESESTLSSPGEPDTVTRARPPATGRAVGSAMFGFLSLAIACVAAFAVVVPTILRSVANNTVDCQEFVHFDFLNLFDLNDPDLFGVKPTILENIF